jgi:hypothetical protein
MQPEVSIDAIIAFFQTALNWADANGHGNSHGVLLRIIRDLETLRALPSEAFAPPQQPEVDSPEETDVNSGDNGSAPSE